jgi:hypothetical protein
MPGKVPTPFASKYMILVAKSWSYEPPKTFIDILIMLVRLFVVQPFRLCFRFTKIDIVATPL